MTSQNNDFIEVSGGKLVRTSSISLIKKKTHPKFGTWYHMLVDGTDTQFSEEEAKKIFERLAIQE